VLGAVVGERSAEGRDEYLQYHNAAIEVPSAATARIEAISKDTGVFLVVGVIERDGKALYCTAIFVDPLQGLLGKHRKLLPTASEVISHILYFIVTLNERYDSQRLIWGQGDGSTLPVFERAFSRSGSTKVTTKMSAAICWYVWCVDSSMESDEEQGKLYAALCAVFGSLCG
jgi:predicted amidohydrolase